MECYSIPAGGVAQATCVPALPHERVGSTRQWEPWIAVVDAAGRQRHWLDLWPVDRNFVTCHLALPQWSRVYRYLSRRIAKSERRGNLCHTEHEAGHRSASIHTYVQTRASGSSRIVRADVQPQPVCWTILDVRISFQFIFDSSIAVMQGSCQLFPPGDPKFAPGTSKIFSFISRRVGRGNLPNHCQKRMLFGFFPYKYGD